MKRFVKWRPRTIAEWIELSKIWNGWNAVNGVAAGLSAVDIDRQVELTTQLVEAVDAYSLNHNPLNKQAVDEALAALMEFMTYLKDTYYTCPPLTTLQQKALRIFTGSGYGDPIPVADNNGYVIKTVPVADGQVRLYLGILGTFPSNHKRKWYNYRVKVVVIDPDMADDYVQSGWWHVKTYPAGEKEMPVGFDTGRPIITRNFLDTERGHMICFCVCLVNAKGAEGPYGPIYWTYVP
jgi:hypothetical protein